MYPDIPSFCFFERNKVINRELCIPDKCSQKATIQFFMIGNGKFCMGRFGQTDHHMTAFLVQENVSFLLQSFDEFLTRNNRQLHAKEYG